jgi:hypothetical protein
LDPALVTRTVAVLPSWCVVSCWALWLEEARDRTSGVDFRDGVAEVVDGVTGLFTVTARVKASS